MSESETKSRKQKTSIYELVYVPVDRSKIKNKHYNSDITKHVNQHNKKNNRYFNPDTKYLKGYTYITNSDVYYEKY